MVYSRQIKRKEIDVNKHFAEFMKLCKLYLEKCDSDKTKAALINNPGRRIAIARSALGLTQLELANLAKVRQADVSRAENHFPMVSIGSIEKIAKALRLEIIDLTTPV